MMPRTAALSVVARAGWGMTLLLAPRRLLAKASHPLPSAAAVNVTRILGVRHLLQAGIVTARPTRAVIGAGAVADALHALTAVTFAAMSRRWRSAAATDALVAGSFALLGQQSTTTHLVGAPRRPH